MKKKKKRKRKKKKVSQEKINYVATSTIKIMDFTVKNRIRNILERIKSHNDFLGTRNYCKICQIKIIYNMDRLYNLKSIQQTWKLYVELKKDLQEFKIVTSHRSFWFKHYSRQFTAKYAGSVTKMHLKNYIEQSYIYLCFLNP